MESRTITITSSRSQSTTVIETGAETLGELKNDLRENNIDYDGLTFYEGYSKSELKSDESPLPRNIPYKGTTTNNLVFWLTVPNKKIKSGAITRQEAYTIIKEQGAQDSCKQMLGRNFTNCSTAELEQFINDYVLCTEEDDEGVENYSTEVRSIGDKVAAAIVELITTLKSKGVLSEADVQSILTAMDRDEYYMSDDFKELFNFVID